MYQCKIARLPIALYNALIDAGIKKETAQTISSEVLTREDSTTLATKQYVADKISAQTWQLIGFMVAQAAVIVGLIKLF